MALDECADVAIFGAVDQIALPVSRHSAIFDLGRALANGDRVRLVTRRGSLELPAAVDKRLQPGHVWVPNGFGARYPKDGSGELEVAGINLNFLTATEDRDPFTGCPQHKYTLCRVERVSP